MNILPVRMNVYHMHAWYSQRSEKHVRFLKLVLQMVVRHPVGAGVELGSLQEQQRL